jgi:hypothetical protein
MEEAVSTCRPPEALSNTKTLILTIRTIDAQEPITPNDCVGSEEEGEGRLSLILCTDCECVIRMHNAR